MTTTLAATQLNAVDVLADPDVLKLVDRLLSIERRLFDALASRIRYEDDPFGAAQSQQRLARVKGLGANERAEVFDRLERLIERRLTELVRAERGLA